MGNGFSRMLQMINVDLKRTYRDDNDFSDNDELRRSQKMKRKNMLPEISKERLTKNSKEKMQEGNTSADNLMIGDDTQIKSKIVKIYKKKVNN
jgi:hypothetical protein